MIKFNWDDFVTGKIAVRCRTEEDAIEFLNKCHNIGLKWCTGKDANIVNCWRIHKEFTVYICGNKGIEFHHTKSLDFIDSLRGIEIVDFISENEIALTTINDKVKNISFEDITKKMHELYLIKNKNYGNSFSKQFEEYGLTSVCIRLEDKLNRLKNLNKQLQDSENGITDVNMDDESIKDTLIDLANYSVLAIMELNKGEE